MSSAREIHVIRARVTELQSYTRRFLSYARVCLSYARMVANCARMTEFCLSYARIYRQRSVIHAQKKIGLS